MATREYIVICTEPKKTPEEKERQLREFRKLKKWLLERSAKNN